MIDRNFWDIDDIAPGRPALIDGAGGADLSYGDLAGLVRAARARLDKGRGLCLITATPSPAFVAMYLAALQAGCPVILQDAKVAQEDALAAVFPLLYAYDPVSDTLITRDEAAGAVLHDDLRLLLSTSGSTGARKFVRLSGRNLASNAAAIAAYLELTEDDRAPTALPLSYSYGMSVLNSHLHVGAALVLTDMPVISEAFWAAFARTGCTSFAGVPQSFTLIERMGHLDRDYPALRYVTQAGGKLGPEAVRRMAELGQRRNWRFFVMYGQTEAAPRIAYLPPEAALTDPASIGRAIPGGTLSVVDDSGAPVPAGIEGELVYQGPNVMMGYATEPADLALGQGQNSLETGDLGHQDAKGLFFITGRKSRFLKLSGKRISLEEVDIWLAEEGIDGIAVGRDDSLGLVHTGAAPLAPRLAEKLDLPQSLVHDVTVGQVPLNQNGKPDLPGALALFDAAMKDRAGPRATGGNAQDAALALFRRQFPGVPLTPRTSFQDLGGTSNDFVDIELGLEEAGIELPQNWHLFSIADLAERAGAAETGPRQPDYATARVVCTILVVLIHVTGLNPQNGLRLPEASIWHDINEWLDPLRMPLFAFLAGFSFQMMNSPANPPRQFLGTILRTLLIPTFFAICAFAAISTVLGTHFAIRDIGDVFEIFYLPYGHFWFIMALTLILLTSYGIFRYLPFTVALPTFLVLALAFMLNGRPGTTPDIWSYNNAVKLLPLFAMGYLYGRHNAAVLAQKQVLLGLAGLGVLAFGIIWQQPDQGIGPHVATFILSLSMIALLLGVAGWIPALGRLAPYAFFIYLWHILGTSGMRRATSPLGLDTVELQIAAGLVAGVAFPVVLYRILGYLPGGRIIRGK